MTSCHQEQVWWAPGLSGGQGPLLEVISDALASAEASASLRPSPVSPGHGSFHHLLIWHGCSRTLSWEDTQKGVCREGPGAGGAEGTDGRKWLPWRLHLVDAFLAGMNPFILKSNPRCRVGETVVLICASAISSSLGEESICYWNR